MFCKKKNSLLKYNNSNIDSNKMIIDKINEIFFNLFLFFIKNIVSIPIINVIYIAESKFIYFYLSISPNTISCVPIIVTTSAIICPFDM